MRERRAEIAKDTLNILASGYYINPSGEKILIADSLKNAIDASRIVTPEDFAYLFEELKNRDVDTAANTSVLVTNETSLQCAHRLVVKEKAEHVMLLNFASAKNPGGGFLGGSQAQEESIARSSGLYPCLLRQSRMYEANKRGPQGFYTDNMIYSPKVPVFKDDAGNLLKEPYVINMLSAPAVNKSAILQIQPQNVGQVLKVMDARIEKMLSVALHSGNRTLILGAWGCGVFGNDPVDISNLFYKHLINNRGFTGAFQKVIFAIPGSTNDRIYRTFCDRFGD